MSKEIPPHLELQCLKVLWRLESGSVKEVREGLSGERLLAYTTVMTLLDRLYKRGTVTRRKASRQFIYVPTVTKETMRQWVVENLVEEFFEGRRAALREYLQSEEAFDQTSTKPLVPPLPGHEPPRGIDTVLL